MAVGMRVAVVSWIFVAGCVAASAQQGADSQAALADHLAKAQGYLRQNKPELAIPELESAVAIDGGNAETQGNLGVLEYFQGRFSDAIPHMRVALDLKPELSKIRGLLGIAELRTGDLDRARKDLETAVPQIEEKKFKVQAGLELVGLYTRSGELDEAAAVIADLRKADPGNAEVLYAAYRTYSDLSSESMMSLALAEPDSAQMHQVMAQEKIKQGDTNGAIANYRKAIAINPLLPGVHFELAELLNTSQDGAIKRQAELEYREALKVNPLDEKSEVRLGEIDAQKGEAAKAEEEFKRAMQMQPADAAPRLGLAKVLTDKGESDEAIALLEETVKLDPTNGVVHYRLGTLYREKGRAEDAKKEIALYKQYKDLKDKLRATYKDLLRQPAEILDDAPAK
jgi:Tfp pilus assembly protein PilF